MIPYLSLRCSKMNPNILASKWLPTITQESTVMQSCKLISLCSFDSIPDLRT